jgi:hypothetical protein
MFAAANDRFLGLLLCAIASLGWGEIEPAKLLIAGDIWRRGLRRVAPDRTSSVAVGEF